MTSHYAIWDYNKNMIKLLLQCGINPNIQNKYNKDTPLHYIIKKQWDNNINELFTKNYIRNYTSQRFLKGELRNEIYLGQRKYCKDIVELLIKYGANVKIKNKDKKPP
ncbi:ankyrin repeat domain-containing protein [Spiroplasma endosymbiont of Lariophagus distinguendus]|uniref:ankyrin repeat domain-containing protein n=1 Tax=Spiroplasma endosymbiont of Lariophagus distinguendus TaxID=2935082 RepID=UPI00207AE09B|nr:ankyrin repeat domain-containing protein [Spiroplasma endosymbiont of Lariophagus distinguendus]